MTNKLKENVINILNNNVKDNIKVLMLSGIIEDVKNSSNNNSEYIYYAIDILIEIIEQNNSNVFKGLFNLYFSSENKNNIAINQRGDLDNFLSNLLLKNCDSELVNFTLDSIKKYNYNNDCSGKYFLDQLISKLTGILITYEINYTKNKSDKLYNNIIETYFNIINDYKLSLTKAINIIINYNFEGINHSNGILEYLFNTLNEEQIKSINFEELLFSEGTRSLKNNYIEWIAKLYFKSLKKSEKVDFIIFKLNKDYYNYQLKIFYNILNEDEKKEFAKTLKDNLKGKNAKKIIDLLSYLDKETVLEIFDNNPEEIKEIKDKDGYNLLDYLCGNLVINNNFELFEYLLENNIDINEEKNINLSFFKQSILSPSMEFFIAILNEDFNNNNIDSFKNVIKSFVKSIANINSKKNNDNNIQLFSATKILQTHSVINCILSNLYILFKDQITDNLDCINKLINITMEALNELSSEYNGNKVYNNNLIEIKKKHTIEDLKNLYDTLINNINDCVSDVSDEIKRSSSSSFNSSEIDNSNSNQLDDNSTENSDNLTTISNSEINDNQEEVRRRRESTSSSISQESDIEEEDQLFQNNEINNNYNDEEKSTDSGDVASDEAEDSESEQINNVEQNNSENKSFLGRFFNPLSMFFAENSESEQINNVEQNNGENESLSDICVKLFLKVFVGPHLPEYYENDEEVLNPEQKNEASEINIRTLPRSKSCPLLNSLQNKNNYNEKNSTDSGDIASDEDENSILWQENNFEQTNSRIEDQSLDQKKDNENKIDDNSKVNSLPRSKGCLSLNLLQNKGSSRNERNNYINKTKERDQINIQKEIINKYKEKMNKSNHYLNSNFKRKKEDIENIKNLTSSIKEYLSQNIENHNFEDKKYKDKYNKICNTFNDATLSKIKIGFKTIVNNGFGGEISYDKLTKRINNIKFSKDSFIIRELSKPEYDNYKDLRNMLINGIRFDYVDKNNLDSEFFIDIIEQFKTKPIYAFDRLFKNDKIIMVANVSGDVICGGIQDKLSSFFSLATKKRRQVNKINRLKKEILGKLKNRRDKKIIENISNIFIRASVDDSYREKVVSEDLIFKNTNTLGEWIIRLFKNINETSNLNIDENIRNSLLSFRNSNKILGFKKYVNDSFDKNLDLISNEISLSSISNLVI